MTKLDRSFYTRQDVVQIAKDLLGKVLATQINGQRTSGIITEVEAYCGRNDKACHANDNRRTKRTEIMYSEGGKAYVYLCYGIHHLFNVTSNREGVADAILVRAVEPLEGIEVMKERRGMKEVKRNLTAGPGIMSQALGITTKDYGTDLLGKHIWIAEHGNGMREEDIIAAQRIGVDYAGDHALRLWRFYIKGNSWVSKL